MPLTYDMVTPSQESSKDQSEVKTQAFERRFDGRSNRRRGVGSDKIYNAGNGALNLTTVTITAGANTSSNTATVTSGAYILGAFWGAAVNRTNPALSASISGTTLTVHYSNENQIDTIKVVVLNP